MTMFDVFNPLQNVTPRFTEEQLQDIIEWFDARAKPLLTINDGEPINVISIEQFMEFLNLKKFHRRSFYYPSYAEVMTVAEELKAGVLRILIKDQFIYALNKWVVEPEIKHELILAFKIFDTEKRDFLEIDDLSSHVTGYADALDPDELRELRRDANVRGDGNIFYEQFVESMFSLAPELNKIKVFSYLHTESHRNRFSGYRDTGLLESKNPGTFYPQTEYLYEDPDEDPSVPPEPEPEPEPETPPPPPPPPPKKEKKKKK